MTQAQILLQALKRGEKLTPLTAVKDYGVMALSQRVGELIRKGHPIIRSRLQVSKRKRVGLYFLRRGNRK